MDDGPRLALSRDELASLLERAEAEAAEPPPAWNVTLPWSGKGSRPWWARLSTFAIWSLPRPPAGYPRDWGRH